MLNYPTPLPWPNADALGPPRLTTRVGRQHEPHESEQLRSFGNKKHMNTPTRLHIIKVAALVYLTAPQVFGATLTYDASLGTSPSAQGWTNVNSSLPESNYSISGGSLLQGDTSPDTNRQYYRSSGINFDFAQDTVLETARLKIISSGLSHPPDPDGLGFRRAGWGIQTFDTQGRFVTLYVGSGGFFLLGKNSESSGLIGFDSTTTFHDYALILNSSGANLTVDGTPMASLTFAQFRTGALTNAPSMDIGDISIAHSSSSQLGSFSVSVVAETPPHLNITMLGVQQVQIAWNANHT